MHSKKWCCQVDCLWEVLFVHDGKLITIQSVEQVCALGISKAVQILVTARRSTLFTNRFSFLHPICFVDSFRLVVRDLWIFENEHFLAECEHICSLDNLKSRDFLDSFFLMPTFTLHKIGLATLWVRLLKLWS